MNQREIEQLLAAYPDMMTVREVSAVLRLDPRSIQRWAKSGKVAALRLGRNYRFPKTDVRRWMLDAGTRPEAGNDARDSSDLLHTGEER
jgi:excisionase family DNA binding protein